MKAQAEQNMHCWTKKYCGIMFCVAKTLSLQQGAEQKEEADRWFSKAAEKGCGDAAFELYQLRNRKVHEMDIAQKVENIRYLREYESSGSWNVRVALCTEYAKKNFAGASPKAAEQYFRSAVMEHSIASNTMPEDGIQRDLDKYGKMRYILVDWLVEVADLKQFSRETLYMTVGLVDRFLQRYVVTRKTLQLLGISCMVIAARFTETDVITIREAAWLTDNTYQYEQVVRTMGTALCAAGGKLRVATTLDFLRLFITVEGVDRNIEEILHYISELALLNIPVGQMPPGLMAAAVFCIASAGMNLPSEQWWPHGLQKWTGLTLGDIAPCVKRVQSDCFRQEDVMDHREEKLKAVADRFERRTKKTPEEAGFTAPTMDKLNSIFQASAEAVDSMGAEVFGAVANAAEDADVMQALITAAYASSSDDCGAGPDALDAEIACYARGDAMDEGSMDGAGVAFSGRDITNTMDAGSNVFAVLKRGSDDSDASRQQTPFTDTNVATSSFQFNQ